MDKKARWTVWQRNRGMLKGGNWLQLFQAEDFLRSIDRDASAIAIYALKGNEQYVEP